MRQARERRPIRWYGTGFAWVPSESGEADYLVDLDDPNWLMGKCDCPDFQIRVEAVIEREEKPEKWDCKHIRRAKAERKYLSLTTDDKGLRRSTHAMD